MTCRPTSEDKQKSNLLLVVKIPVCMVSHNRLATMHWTRVAKMRKLVKEFISSCSVIEQTLGGTWIMSPSNRSSTGLWKLEYLKMIAAKKSKASLHSRDESKRKRKSTRSSSSGKRTTSRNT